MSRKAEERAAGGRGGDAKVEGQARAQHGSEQPELLTKLALRALGHSRRVEPRLAPRFAAMPSLAPAPGSTAREE